MIANPAAGQPDAVTNAKNLFEFLVALQRTKRKPVRLVSDYARQGDGRVTWLHRVPEHEKVILHLSESDESSSLLSVEKVPESAPPEPPETVENVVTGWGKADQIPALADTEAAQARRPEFDRWLSRWQAWAEAEKVDKPVRDFYKELYEARLVANTKSEEYELVLGLGCLSWKTASDEPIQRHTLTVPIKIDYDDQTGTITVEVDEAGQPVSLEIEEFVEPSQIADSGRLSVVKADIAFFDGNPLDEQTISQLLTRLSHVVAHDCTYDNARHELPPTARPHVVLAPAIIVRQRSGLGLLQIFQAIADRIESTGEVPPGLLPLIDPNHLPPSNQDRTPGAIVSVGSEYFLPLPLNGRQLDVVNRVDSHAQVVVQGPPGTGKTYTIAALLSHLLAQGKRVLVTAQTDRALEEVRNKLPEAIKPLSVSVIGTSRDDMADLKYAVEQIARRSEDHDVARLKRDLADDDSRVDRLRRERSDAVKNLIDARAAEVAQWSFARELGTRAHFARTTAREAHKYDWIVKYFEPQQGSCPVGTDELREWRDLLLDEELDRERTAASERLLDANLPSSEEFATMCYELKEAERTLQSVDGPDQGRWSGWVDSETEEARRTAHQFLTAVLDAYAQAAESPFPWVRGAVCDVTVGHARQWTYLYRSLTHRVAEAERLLVQEIGFDTEVSLAGDAGGIEALATSLATYFASAGDLATRPDGTPKIGVFTNKVVKESRPLFDQVRVNGLPPTGLTSIRTLLAYIQLGRIMRAMDSEWQGVDTPLSPDLSADRRLRWHRDALSVLQVVHVFAGALEAARRALESLGLRLTWREMREAMALKSTIESFPLRLARARRQEALDKLESQVAAWAAGPNASPVIAQLQTAIRDRDVEAYSVAFDRNSHLITLARSIKRRDWLEAKMISAAPALAGALREHPQGDEWATRIDQVPSAWTWLQITSWLDDDGGRETGALQHQVQAIEEQIIRAVGQLAANRAWSHALARIDQETRHHLQTYVQQVRRLGKGTGKYADHVRTEIRRSMNQCRPAIPVWIMPLYRIAEQFTPEENLFDVVIVDEASQASVEAVFLQYFAPKIVVVGDDKQVSPAGVGVDQQKLRDLADRHMPGNPDRHASWDDPSRSLFDEARGRYGGVITLTEHRRCAPEIIGFSNLVAYQPEGVKLEPVRQIGTDRLPPIRTVYVSDGYRTRRNVNVPEVDAVVDQVRKCIADPAYAGMTLGVISLLGGEQARAIRDKLLDQVPVEEWTARELSVGDASAFQGSERDVIFLSLVATVEADQRMPSLTRDLYRQRFNVAASRAKDQMWLFHSVRMTDLSNPEDMRHQLLRYCLDTAVTVRRGSSAPQLVPHDLRVDPFDSLFEQRIYNHLVSRDYDVRPQTEALGYRIDLVVHGASGNLAIECDGDQWHGPDAFDRDLARQRELERCGWLFHRIRESAYYRDPNAEVTNLVQALDARGIAPVDWTATSNKEVLSTEAEPATHDQSEELTHDQHPPDNYADSVTDVIAEEQRDPEQDSEVVYIEPPAVETASSNGALRPYKEFRASVPSVDSPVRAIGEGISTIVAVEGPVTESRLLSVYARAAGVRLGRGIRESIRLGATSAVRRGLIEADAPTRTADRIYRLPEQPEVIVRELGTRRLDTVPINELAAMIVKCRSEVVDPLDDDVVFREVLSEYGLKSLTETARGPLSLARSLADRPRGTVLGGIAGSDASA